MVKRLAKLESPGGLPATSASASASASTSASAPVLAVAVATVDRPALSRLEGYLSVLTALGASYGEHLARATAVLAATSTASIAAATASIASASASASATVPLRLSG